MAEQSVAATTTTTTTTSFCSDIDDSSSSSSSSNSSLRLSQQQQLNYLQELKELHYIPYNSSNSLTIYSYVIWHSKKRLLVATKETNFKEIYFKQNDQITTSATGNEDDLLYLKPVVNVHKMPKLKPGAYISSIDVFDVDSFCVFCVAFVQKKKQLNDSYYIHIYCDFETNEFDLILECNVEFDMETLVHNVTHLIYYDFNGVKNHMIMANCNQRKNVLFKVDAKNCRFERLDMISNYFCEYKPEYLTHNVTSNDMKYIDGKTKRLTAIGCQNGLLNVYVVDASRNEILKHIQFENDSLVTRVQLFTTKTHYNWSKLDVNKYPVNLLVLRSLEPTRVFKNILVSGFDDYQDLEQSCSYDLVTCATVYDATFSTFNAIILGTFGRYVLFYCYNEHDQRYELRREVQLKHSIVGILNYDLTNNCANDLAILTLNGVSVWQYDCDLVVEIAQRKLNANTKIESLIETSSYLNKYNLKQTNNEITKL